MPEKSEMSEKEKRVRAITRIYYSNPKVQESIFNFSKNREVVPRYFEAFGKRPDTLQYPSDIMGLVNKGATSFHASEELWHNPLEINSDMSHEEMQKARKSWDLLIDIDSPFLDYSKIAAKLLAEELENQGIKNYGIKFSGGKGFHLIIPAEAFPEKVNEIETKTMFPEWARAIVQYLMMRIRQEYGKRVTALGINFDAVEERMHLSQKDLLTTKCPNCQTIAVKKTKVFSKCDRCGTTHERPDYKETKRKIRCTDEICSGFLQTIESKEYFFCEKCNITSLTNSFSSGNKMTFTKEARTKSTTSEFTEDFAGEKIASLDLVLVAPRHLFRTPYSLHEKTALASIVLDKSQIDSFTPKDANPMKINIKEFYKTPKRNEAARLLESALSWKSIEESKIEKPRRISEEFITDFTKVTEDMFPEAIKRLLKGLPEGRKRGLFVLITFFKALNYPEDYISQKCREWNEKNTPPLKEGYVKSQLDWHFKQKKKILPPNYSNDSFYKDLKLIDENPSEKNPIVEVMRKLRKIK